MWNPYVFTYTQTGLLEIIKIKIYLRFTITVKFPQLQKVNETSQATRGTLTAASEAG